VYVSSGYLGAFPNSGPVTEDGALYVFELQQHASGVAFKLLETVRQGGSFPLWMTTDAAKRFLYVVSATDLTRDTCTKITILHFRRTPPTLNNTVLSTPIVSPPMASWSTSIMPALKALCHATSKW
jgi:hypothetical protein